MHSYGPDRHSPAECSAVPRQAAAKAAAARAPAVVKPAFLVAASRARREAVLAVRGTHELDDLLADADAGAATLRLRVDGVEADAGPAHHSRHVYIA